MFLPDYCKFGTYSHPFSEMISQWPNTISVSKCKILGPTQVFLSDTWAVYNHLLKSSLSSLVSMTLCFPGFPPISPIISPSYTDIPFSCTPPNYNSQWMLKLWSSIPPLMTLLGGPWHPIIPQSWHSLRAYYLLSSMILSVQPSPISVPVLWKQRLRWS